jgi:xylan 1,4-beta-xylosidase
MSRPIPVLLGDYPDPSLLRVGDRYYMTHSTNTCAPALQVWRSNDLLAWTPIANALDRTFDGDVWAPDLIEHDGRFFIYYNTSGRNKVVTAERMEGPWSDPVDLNIPHIDPGHVVDTDGKRYLHLSGGHVVALTDDGLAAAGPVEQVYDVWPIPEEWRIEGIALESPKLFWRDGWCYLITAQGGTAGPSTSHMAIVARSRRATGPWEYAPNNPLIRTHSRLEPWWSKGHATLFQGPRDEWWAVYHAYRNGYVTLGRYTLIERIDWSDDGWPIEAGEDRSGQDTAPVAHLPELSDDFSAGELGWQWRFVGELDHGRYALKDGALTLRAKGDSPSDTSAPLCLIPRDAAYTVEVDVEITEGEIEAGLLFYYDQRCYTGIAVSNRMQSAQGIALRLHRSHQIALKSETGAKKATLRMVNDHHEVDYWVSLDGEWQKLPHGVDTAGWNHNTLGGFVSLRVALYAAGEGAAEFRNFRYMPLI